MLQYVNGERYEGYWKDDKADGKGTLTYIHGDKYVGDWQAAKKQGQVRWARLSAAVMPTPPLAARFQQGVCATGAEPSHLHEWPTTLAWQGELYYANGDMFRGEWVQDRATGNGILMYANNNRYEGSWLDDRRHGQGAFYHADGSRYEGEWAQGRKEGKGTLYFNNGDSFTGYWSEGVISGPGVLSLNEESPWNLADL